MRRIILSLLFILLSCMPSFAQQYSDLPNISKIFAYVNNSDQDGLCIYVQDHGFTYKDGSGPDAPQFSKNCDIDVNGNVKKFRAGNSCVVGIRMQPNDRFEVDLTVFNNGAKNFYISKLKGMGFKMEKLDGLDIVNYSFTCGKDVIAGMDMNPGFVFTFYSK